MNDSPFSFELPAGWDDQTVYYFRGPNEGDREHLLMLVLNRHLQHESVVDFAKEQTDAMTSGLQGVEVIRDEEITQEDGNQACEFVYKWTPAENVHFFKKYVFVIKGGIGFTFSCDFSKKSLKTVGIGMKDAIEALVPGTYEPLEEE